MITRGRLETYQVLVYAAALLAGLALGTAGLAVSWWELALWPLLGTLLFATFTQIPWDHLRAALRSGRFLAAALLGNFVVLPLVVWGLLQIVPGDPALQLGVALVLLVPCTDWFITFTQQGRGDSALALVFTPVALLVQTLMLPLYLTLFFGSEWALSLATGDMALAFVGVILVPFVLAAMTRYWLTRTSPHHPYLEGLAWCPVPLLALVILIIAATQVTTLEAVLPFLPLLTGVYVAFLLAAAGLAVVGARCFKLPASQGRVLAFSFASRNSFVVLPLALALPASMEMAAMVVVWQSLVELVGMLCLLWWVPNRGFRNPDTV